MGARLAAETDQVAAALEAGDPTGAHAQAVEVQAIAVEAIEAGRVPRPLRAPLLRAVNRLVASIDVPPPPPPPSDEDDEEEDDEEGGNKDKGKGKKDKGDGEEDGDGDD